MPFLQIILLALTGFIAGLVNAVAGGGTHGLVSWSEAAITAATCIAGGYFGVVAAWRVPEAVGPPLWSSSVPD